MVEFADQRRRGRGPMCRLAIRDAATLRLRPIAMTLISTVLGAVPLVIFFASGRRGRGRRQAIGWVILRAAFGIAAVYHDCSWCRRSTR